MKTNKTMISVEKRDLAGLACKLFDIQPSYGKSGGDSCSNFITISKSTIKRIDQKC
jgi:hypothetical protein